MIYNRDDDNENDLRSWLNGALLLGTCAVTFALITAGEALGLTPTTAVLVVIGPAAAFFVFILVRQSLWSREPACDAVVVDGDLTETKSRAAEVLLAHLRVPSIEWDGDGRVLRGTTRPSWMSMGENITVTFVRESGRKVRVEIQSEPAWPNANRVAPINAKNVRRIADSLSSPSVVE